MQITTDYAMWLNPTLLLSINQIYNSESKSQQSTDKIFDAIKSLNFGVDLSKNDLYAAMLDAGFVFKPRRRTSGIDFRWLLVQK